MTALRQVAVALADVVLLGLGVWCLGAEVAETTRAAVGLTAGWFVLVGLGCLLVARRVRELRVAVLGAFGTAVVTLGVLSVVTTRETTVDERLDEGRPASEIVSKPAADDLLAPQP